MCTTSEFIICQNFQSRSIQILSCKKLTQATNFIFFQTERFADDNFKHDENGRKFSKIVENTLGKREIARNFSFSYSVFKRLVLQTHKNKGLYGKGLNIFYRAVKIEFLILHKTTKSYPCPHWKHWHTTKRMLLKNSYTVECRVGIGENPPSIKTHNGMVNTHGMKISNRCRYMTSKFYQPDNKMLDWSICGS